MDDIERLTSTKLGGLEMAFAAMEWDDSDMLALVGCTLDRSGGSNWVQENGGLPEYICQVARSISTKRGKSISNAIQIAVGVIKRWAKGVGDVNADTRAKAAKAVAQWEALKAKARAKGAVKASADVDDMLMILAREWGVE